MSDIVSRPYDPNSAAADTWDRIQQSKKKITCIGPLSKTEYDSHDFVIITYDKTRLCQRCGYTEYI